MRDNWDNWETIEKQLGNNCERQLRETIEKENWERQLRETIERDSWERQLRETIERDNWERQLREIIERDNWERQLRETIEKDNWERQLRETIEYDRSKWKIQLLRFGSFDPSQNTNLLLPTNMVCSKTTFIDFLFMMISF